MALADVRILTHKVIGIKSCKNPVTEGAHADYRDGRDKPAMTSRNRHEFCPSYEKQPKWLAQLKDSPLFPLSQGLCGSIGRLRPFARRRMSNGR